MSSFDGTSKIKVRCIDCVRLSGTRCSAKKVKVSVKKRRTCSSYSFKGEYENREPAETMYVPYIDRKTRKMIQRLLSLGVSPVPEKVQPALDTPLIVPASTATSSTEDLSEIKVVEDGDQNLIWLPGGQGGSDNDRG
jgi:hypothetical protein